MRYPKNIQQGGTIGFVAPSFGCQIEPYYSAFGNAQKKFREMGYQLQLGPNCYAGEGIGISNTPEKCGQELTEYYCSRENDCLISCGGGELMCETMSHVDFERLKAAEPKWYLGYSDNTNMTYLLATICDTASVYGPCAASFGMEPPHPSIKDTFALLRGKKLSFESYELYEKESLKSEENPLAPYNCTEPVRSRFFVPDSKGKLKESSKVKLQGRLLGGCLDCLANLSGTEFDRTREFCEAYREDGILWFLEACDLNVFSIRRALFQLKHTGWFAHTAGFVFGRSLNGGAMMDLDEAGAVLPVLEEYRVPVILDADFGHLPPAIPLICGSMAEIGGISGKITISMSLC